MNTELKASLSPKKTFALLSLLTVISGALGCILGEIILPITISRLGIIFVFEKTKGRIFGYLTSIILLVINATTIFLKISSSPFALQAIVLALILSIAFKKRFVKSNTALVMTIICGVFTIISYAILAMMISGDYSVDGVLNFYDEIVTLLKNTWMNLDVKAYEPIGKMFGVDITAELLGEIFDVQVRMIISYLFILSFGVVGLGLKFFTILFNRLSSDSRDVNEWKFELSAVYAYSYVIVMLLTVFANDPADIFYAVVNNLHNIFMVMFAYIGVNVIANILSKKMNKFLSVLIPIGAVMLLGSFATEILAVVGVFSTINKGGILPREE